MTSRLLPFDVHRRTGSELTGYGYAKSVLCTIEAPQLRDAKKLAAELFPDFAVVVIPQTKRSRENAANPDRTPTNSHRPPNNRSGRHDVP